MKVECEFCGLSFNKKPADIKRTNHNLCSKKCTGKFRRKRYLDSFFVNVMPDDNGCWNWTGVTNQCGYGHTPKIFNTHLAHRIAYALRKGDPEGFHVLHTCDNPPCINPDHLFLGTHADNMEDMTRKGRRPSKLAPKQVVEIRGSDKPNRALATSYGVSERTIRAIKGGTVWKGVIA